MVVSKESAVIRFSSRGEGKCLRGWQQRFGLLDKAFAQVTGYENVLLVFTLVTRVFVALI